jgi:hypothetical protein
MVTEIRDMTVPQLHDLRRRLCQFKHKASRSRRITRIERQLGAIKRELHHRYQPPSEPVGKARLERCDKARCDTLEDRPGADAINGEHAEGPTEEVYQQ